MTQNTKYEARQIFMKTLLRMRPPKDLTMEDEVTYRKETIDMFKTALQLGLDQEDEDFANLFIAGELYMITQLNRYLRKNA